jgi:Protein of unknown function (DUF3532).
MAKWEWTKEEINAEFDRAEKAGSEARLREPRAQAARYDRNSNRLVIELTNGATFMVPVDQIQGLASAGVEQIQEVEVVPQGAGLHWETLEVDLSVPALLMGTFGTRSWMQELGKQGGSKTSPAKAAAARANGKKGGRPTPTAT